MKKILVVGLGGCGAKTIGFFTRLPGIEHYDTCLIETDKEILDSSLAQKKFFAKGPWVLNSGRGCGGNVQRGEQAVNELRPELQVLFEQYDYVLVTCGLGGGTGSGGCSTLASVLKTVQVPSFFIVSLPFASEGYRCRQNAEQVVTDLQENAGVLVIPLPNELLFSQLDENVAVTAAFEFAANEIASSIFGLGELLSSQKVLGPDYADLYETLSQKKHLCRLGVGRADSQSGLERSAAAMEQMLESPFLGGINKLKECDVLYVCMTAGPDLSFAEMKRTLENMAVFIPGKGAVSSGVSINPAYDDKIQIFTLSVTYTASKNSVSRRMKNSQPDDFFSSELPLEQGTFSLPFYSKGYFSGGPSAVIGTVDLDIPTYQRKNKKIDSGKTMR